MILSKWLELFDCELILYCNFCFCREKLSKEAEEAEKIRQEARIKKEQEKQKSARMLALMEEQNRKLKIADSFRRKNLLIRYGLSPWNRYMDLLW